MLAQLKINGRDEPLSAAHSLRFVEVPGEQLKPVLYLHGRRVTQPVQLALLFELPADVHPNANTT